MKFQYSRTVANGDLYICPCCGEEIFLPDEDSPFNVYCDCCGTEFFEEDDAGIELLFKRRNTYDQ